MQEINITYETLYELLRKEKNKAELQELDPLFNQKLAKYIREKQEILRSQEQKNSIFTLTEVQKTRKQIENIQKIVKEFYEKRESKIIQVAIINSRLPSSYENDKSLMLHSEKQLYDEVANTLNNFRNSILHNLVIGNIGPIQEEPKDLKKTEKPKITTKEVKFKHITPKFVGTDLTNYGPFEKGDTAHLPLDIAELLIDKNQVEEINNEDA